MLTAHQLAACRTKVVRQAAEELERNARHGAGSTQTTPYLALPDLAQLPERIEALEQYLENHLLRQEEQPDGEPRLFMLETIREFGLGCLGSGGELEATHLTHAAYFL